MSTEFCHCTNGFGHTRGTEGCVHSVRVVNPEAIGDPNATPVVYLGEEAGKVLGIRQRTACDCSCHRCCVPLDESCLDCEDAAAHLSTDRPEQPEG